MCIRTRCLPKGAISTSGAMTIHGITRAHPREFAIRSSYLPDPCDVPADVMVERPGLLPIRDPAALLDWSRGQRGEGAAPDAEARRS